MNGYELTDRQADIVEAMLEGALFVAAGAGSGKTTVVMEGFVEALRQERAGIDEILTITYTEKAAGDMMRKVRSILRDKGMLKERRLIEHARISTIHGFCARLIRSHALALGIDPDFKVLDESGAGVIRQEAFDISLERLFASRGELAAELVFLMDPDRRGVLLGEINGVYDTLRSQGQRHPDFSLPEIDLRPALAELAQAAMAAATALQQAGSSANKTYTRLKKLESLEGETDPRTVRDVLLQNKPGISSNVEKKAPGETARVCSAYDACLAATYLPCLELFRELLDIFSGEYATYKREAGLLDFEDLQLEALRLLSEHPGIADRVASQFKYIIVDEFQDTNRLQCEIIGKIDRGNVCFVGDENQSIYRFRHAEVGLFREKRDEHDGKERLRKLDENFRSQPEILDFVDRVFKRDYMLARQGYLSLVPRAKPDGFSEEARVEVILVDGDRYDREKANTATGRQAEAELMARRLEELYADGLGYEPGKTAILVRTRADLDTYRQALDRAGIPNYLGINKDYFSKFELGDALNLLRLLVNPLDDLALLAVLRSPVVGATDETLMLLRLAAGHGSWKDGPPPLWPVLSEPEKLAEMEEKQRSVLTGFREELERYRRRSRAQSLSDTVRDVTDFRNYAAIAAAGRNGRQSLANLLKLQDLADTFEDSWGNDLAAFVEFLDEQQSGADEADAPTEEEGGGAVRFLTVHKSKGLEFDLVVWANMGGERKNDLPTVLLGDDNKVGFRVKDPSGKNLSLIDFDAIAEVEKAKNLEEDKRIGYVAMTRARRKLILCGITNIDKPAEASAGKTPMDWVKGPMGLYTGHGLPDDSSAWPDPERQTLLADFDKVPVLVTVCADPEALLEKEREKSVRRAAEPVEKVSSAILEVPHPAVFVPPRISPTAIDTYRSCPRRYYLERVLRFDGYADDGKFSGAGGDKKGLDAMQKGSLVHALLEQLEFPIGELPSDSLLDEYAARVLDPGVSLTGEDRDEARRYVGNLAEAPVVADFIRAEKEGGLEREKSFTYLLGETIIGGKMDAVARVDGQVVVVDYKTGRLTEDYSWEVAADKYRYQMAAYAIAAGRLYPGLPVKVCLVFLDQPSIEYPQIYKAGDLKRLETDLSELIATMGSGSFEPLDAFDKHRCVNCIGGPNKTRLCPVANGGRR